VTGAYGPATGVQMGGISQRIIQRGVSTETNTGKAKKINKDFHRETDRVGTSIQFPPEEKEGGPHLLKSGKGW